MRIGGKDSIGNGSGTERKGEGTNKYNVGSLYKEMLYLKPLFETILLVNPYERRIIGVNEYGLEDTKKDCTVVCPLKNDACGCICKDAVSTNDNRCRFLYNKTTAYLVISKAVNMQYRSYVLVLIMKLNPSFQFGAHTDMEAIDNITKLSSNLVIDPLTQIFNRKYLMDNINYIMEKCQKARQPLCIACIDIDNFKRFNDTYGHEFGDKVLKTVADNMVRATDVIEEAYNIRIGGDEFVIVGVNIDKQRFKAIMSKLCVMVDSTKLPYEREMVGIRISIGVSEMLTDRIDSYKDFYDKADGQLYKAKEAGKGCVR